MPPVVEPMPVTLSAYRIVTAAGATLAPHLLERRLARGKENPDRIAERRGQPSAPRPPGPLVWVHAASVGEFVAVLPLVERIRARDFAVLMTTGTVTSAALAEKRLPSGAVHQFVPLDTPAFVARFLDYWHPGLAVFVESDLWPNTILTASQRRIPMIVVNGRMSERSYSRWRYFPKTIETLLRQFDLCLVRSRSDAERFGALGAPRISITGNLKFDVPALPVDARKFADLTNATKRRIVVVAASTHPGEDDMVIAAHRRLKITFPDLLTIIAPRHPQRGTAIVDIATTAHLRSALRSRGASPTDDIDIYVFDTLGELGLIYQLTPIVFMGGSLVRHGGQNPIEAIKLGAAILHGPHVTNFSDLYEQLDRTGAAELIVDADRLAAMISAWIRDGAERERVAERARHCVDNLSGALDLTMSALEPYFMQLRIQNRAVNA
ncbi:MAG TPA: 3-deoxy-D-manno-octulosonic acid transferase [Xanthobacteraceae bacterium]|nr:3-deoxy-D-manno-octulosonic acid transferase [Xanthobacteraceae bacterium]